MTPVDQIRSVLKSLVTLPKERLAVFFKTGEGQYAEGDKFIGVSVPNLRKVAKEFRNLSLEDIQILIESEVNEERFLALIILVDLYPKNKEEVYQFYLKNLDSVNNWNLVDASAHHIIGAHLFKEDKRLLLTLSASKSMWHRRIAVVATWFFIRKGEVEWTFRLATLLMKDPHDLIHKAVGWMLREAGKKDEAHLRVFLNEHAPFMPRTMLRYAIEKMTEQQRKAYMVLGRVTRV